MPKLTHLFLQLCLKKEVGRQGFPNMDITYRISALNTRGLESKNAGFLVGYHLREVNIQVRSQLQFFS